VITGGKLVGTLVDQAHGFESSSRVHRLVVVLPAQALGKRRARYLTTELRERNDLQSNPKVESRRSALPAEV